VGRDFYQMLEQRFFHLVVDVLHEPIVLCMVGTRLCLPGVFDCGLADMP
jgi:hypothetical protein